MTAAAGVVGLLGVACERPVELGGFEDDQGEPSEEPRPPDLPDPACSLLFPGQCEEGFKCSYVVDAELGPTHICVEVLGDGQADEACESIGDSDSCEPGHQCWGVDEDGQGGVCVAYCSSNLSCAADDKSCSVSVGGLLPLCLTPCHPHSEPTECEPGWGCYMDAGKRWSCDRDRSGELLGQHGDPCDCLNCCDPGFVCLVGSRVDAEGCGADGAEGCCGAICELGQEPPGEGEDPICPGELEACRSLYSSDAQLEGYEQVGICDR